MQSICRSLRRQNITVARRFYSSQPAPQQKSQNSAREPVQSETTSSLLPDNVDADNSSVPPSAGPSGYPSPPSKENPVRETNLRSYDTIIPRYRLHCHSSRNNTITTLTRPNGQPIAWFSGGSCGFKKGNRASYEAGYQCAVRMFKRVDEIVEREALQVDLFFKGFGQGREALQKALLSGEGNTVRQLVSSVTDRTPIKIGGTRSKKARRL
ncbi:hypothetical protein AX17_000935 [Amanita inopinata Kibby_2008]|nr:hypothetical protein AX17_000935 [Amanita inopinata Kibby_2008]